MLAEAIDAGAAVDAVFATPAGWDAAGELAPTLACPTYVIDDRALRRLTALETPPGVVAVVRQRLETVDALLDGGAPVLLLAGVGDPGNAGTLLRSAEAFGVARVIFGKGAVEPYNPKVVRGSMGAIFRLRMAEASPADLQAAATARGYAVVAAEREGEPLPDFPFPERAIFAVGGERHGTKAWLVRRDAAVSIPQTGRGESLNAAVAGSILLYEYARRNARN